MKKRNPFLILLLCLAALIVLSGCASKDAGRQDAAAALPNTSEAASAPAEDISPPPENPSDTEEAPEQTDTEEEPAVTMTVWSAAAEEDGIAYTLTPEDSSRVIAIFESAEKEYPSSPAADEVSVRFEYSENCFGTTPEDLSTITGNLNGEYVALELNEAACIELRQIITNYANADMPNEWPNTPSAGEE